MLLWFKTILTYQKHFLWIRVGFCLRLHVSICLCSVFMLCLGNSTREIRILKTASSVPWEICCFCLFVTFSMTWSEQFNSALYFCMSVFVCACVCRSVLTGKLEVDGSVSAVIPLSQKLWKWTPCTLSAENTQFAEGKCWNSYWFMAILSLLIGCVGLIAVVYIYKRTADNTQVCFHVNCSLQLQFWEMCWFAHYVSVWFQDSEKNRPGAPGLNICIDYKSKYPSYKKMFCKMKTLKESYSA